MQISKFKPKPKYKGSYKEIEGNLITLAQNGDFDVIAHCTNCFCVQGAGIAPQMVKAFGTDKFWLEKKSFVGDFNKMGQVDFMWVDPKTKEQNDIESKKHTLAVVNCYGQFSTGPKDDGSIPLDYEALTLCFRKINHYFEGMKIGLPWIGTGLAGGSKEVVKKLVQENLKNCDVIMCEYIPPTPIFTEDDDFVQDWINSKRK